MKIQNNKAISKLSKKTLKAEKTRNIVAIIAISLTTLLFASIFTIAFSLNESYQTYTFRQIGGYAHGSFKKINTEQKNLIVKNKNVKDYGMRSVVGFLQDGEFNKTPAEVLYMDKNVAKWSYIKFVEGNLPEKENEVAMDSSALQKLGIQAKAGEKVKLKFNINENDQIGESETKEFILSGYWENDDLLKNHLVAISEKYFKALENKQISQGHSPFMMDMQVMLTSSLGIEKQMDSILTAQGLESGNIAIGVNWGYTGSQISKSLDFGTMTAMTLILAIVILVGYLIINNVFQISVSNDIRLYGLLKTIGVTAKQLRKIVIKQAIYLCMFGVPVGILIGYALGNVLTPFIIKQMNIEVGSPERSYSYLIFIFSAAFSIITVLAACMKPAKYASKISPIDATKYIDCNSNKKSRKKTKGAKVFHMAIANVGGNKKKSALVIASIALSLVILNTLSAFVSGFSLDKYLEKKSSADFIISSPDYFNYKGGNITDEDIETIKEDTKASQYGAAYVSNSQYDRIWILDEQWNAYSEKWKEDEKRNAMFYQDKKNGYSTCGISIEALDEVLFNKLNIVKGEFDYRDLNGIALVLPQDEYGNISIPDGYPEVGEKIKIDYIKKYKPIDTRTGEQADETTPGNFLKYQPVKFTSSEYVVKAYVTVPYSIGLRYSDKRFKAILPYSTFTKDNASGSSAILYAFDTATTEDEERAEMFLGKLSQQNEQIMYESKTKLRTEFNNFKRMFTVIGGLLCLIIGFVGLLNYVNTLMTSFFARKREFAIIQAIGMTGKQLKKMFIYEGCFYVVISSITAITLSGILYRPINLVLEKVFWFYKGDFTLMPILSITPLLIIVGLVIPYLMFKKISRYSIVERIRE